MATHEGEVDDSRISTVSKDNQSYPALVWRKFKRSIPGMVGLTMVCFLLFTAELFIPSHGVRRRRSVRQCQATDLELLKTLSVPIKNF